MSHGFEKSNDFSEGMYKDEIRKQKLQSKMV